MCCGSTTQKHEEILARIQPQKPPVKSVDSPSSAAIKSGYYPIPKEIKQQLLMAQQHARIIHNKG